MGGSLSRDIGRGTTMASNERIRASLLALCGVAKGV